ANYGVYGVRKMWHAMRRAGWDVGRDQCARLMRKAGLRGVVRGRKVHTTTPAETSRQVDHPGELLGSLVLDFVRGVMPQVLIDPPNAFTPAKRAGSAAMSVSFGRTWFHRVCQSTPSCRGTGLLKVWLTP